LIEFRQNWSKQEIIYYVLRCKNLLIIFDKRKNCHSSGRNISLSLFDKNDCSNYTVITLLPTTYKILPNNLFSRLTPYVHEVIWGSKVWISTQQINYWSDILYLSDIGQKVGGEALYNILIEFGVPMKLVWLIKICLNETIKKSPWLKICHTPFLFRMVWNKEMLYSRCSPTLL